MKKLMIAAAIVCAAAVSQAATATWTTGVVSYDGDKSATSGGTTIADGNWTYLFAGISAEDYAALIADKNAQAIFEAATLDNSNYDASYLAIGDGYVSMDVQQFSGGTASFYDETEYGSKAYAVIISTVEEDGKIVAYTATAVEATKADMGYDGEGGAVLRWGAKDGTGTTWTATAVPEPTSGLLLLLGVAGLALRRRRA